MTDDFFDDAAKSAKDAQDETGKERNPALKWTEPRTFKGVLKEARIQPLKDGSMKYLCTVVDEADEQDYTLWLGEGPRLLVDGWFDAAPAIGSKILIDYAGKKRSPESGFEYGLFQIRAEISDHKFWRDMVQQKAAKEERARADAVSGADYPTGSVSADDLPDAF